MALVGKGGCAPVSSLHILSSFDLTYSVRLFPSKQEGSKPTREACIGGLPISHIP